MSGQLEEDEKMGRVGVVFSTFSVVVGAFLSRAVTYQDHVLRYSTVGLILMCVGALGLIASQGLSASSRLRIGTEQLARDRVSDLAGRVTSRHEEVSG